MAPLYVGHEVVGWRGGPTPTHVVAVRIVIDESQSSELKRLADAANRVVARTEASEWDQM